MCNVGDGDFACKDVSLLSVGMGVFAVFEDGVSAPDGVCSRGIAVLVDGADAVFDGFCMGHGVVVEVEGVVGGVGCA